MNQLLQLDIQTIKDILLILGSMTTILFTILGYGKWKKELKGRSKYELSKTCLKAVYSFRDGFKALRSQFTFANEFPPNSNPRKPNESEEERYVINNRLNSFNQEFNNLKSLLPEIEVEFDESQLELFKELFGHIRDYQFKVNEYFQLLDNTNNHEHLNKLRSVVKDNSDPNETTIKFNKTIEKIESEIKSIIKKY